MKVKHTPGPWEVGEANHTLQYEIGVRAVDEDGFVICDITNDGYGPEENEANAKLIAAAPEMLEFLMETVSVLSPEFKSLADRIESVIKKATE